MSDFLDRIVTRAGRGATSLRPRVAHRFGPPEHQLASSLEGPEPGGGEDDDASADTGRGASLDEPPRAPRGLAPLGSGERDQSSAEADGGALAEAVPTPVGQGRDARFPSPAPTAGVEPAPGPAGTRISTPDDGGAAAPNSFVERLRARVHETRSRLTSPSPGQAQPAVASTPVSVERPAAPAARTAPVGDPPPVRTSRAAGNEADFWRFLYGPQPEPPVKPGPLAAEPMAQQTRPPATDLERTAAAPSSRVEARAVVRVAAAPAIGSGAPAAATTITIGRVEVRALPPPVAARPAPAPARRPPRLGLADYMRQTAPGARRS